MSTFKVQKPLPEKHGVLRKSRRLMGGTVARYCKISWEDRHGVLLFFKDEKMTIQAKALTLETSVLYPILFSHWPILDVYWYSGFLFSRAYPKKDSTQDKASDKLFAITLEFDKKTKKVLYAPSELERDEWVDVIRKYATQSNIKNSYDFSHDSSSKLGEGVLHERSAYIVSCLIFCIVRLFRNCVQGCRPEHREGLGAKRNLEIGCGWRRP